MSKELEVSLVNYLCPVCGNIAEEGIIMNSLLSEEAAKERWKLRCLEMAGVDNWTWYDQAMSDYEADEYTNDELTKDYNEAN